MEIFPASVLLLWNKYEIRGLVLLSLLWQVILIICGPMRKYKRGGIKGVILRSVVWVTYLTADQLATVALGILATNQIEFDKSNSKRESKDQFLQALWAPFLLLHLGGPDTITAYSLEDNTLWMRHLLGLIVQVSVAFYIFLRSWGNNALTFVAIPVFVSGIIKYSERNWVLRSATADQFRKSLPSKATLQPPNSDHILKDPELKCVHKGYSLFPIVKRLHVNGGLYLMDLSKSFYLAEGVIGMDKEAPVHAFKVVEVQLGFLYDVLYTKASIIYTKKGLFLRLVSALSITCALVAFVLVIDSDDAYSRVDVVITYTLFIGGIFLEIYALFALTFSDWTVCWLTKRERSCLLKSMYSFISLFRSILSGSKDKLYMSQLSLMDLCLKNPSRSCIENYLFSKILPLKFNLLRNQRLEEVNTHTKEVIYRKLKFDGNGGGVRERLVLAKSVLRSHLITEIVYHSTSPGGDIREECKRKREACKKISDYLFYVLLQHPSMLPPWIGGTEYIQDTINHAQELCHHAESPAQAAQILMQYLNTNKDDGLKHRKSILYELSHKHEGTNLIFEELYKQHDKWLEMLKTAVYKFEWGSHAQQLASGGEFLTHVSLLKADISLSQVVQARGNVMVMVGAMDTEEP